MRVDVAISSAARLGEGPRWDARTGRLLWVDIEGCELHVWDPSSGADRVVDVPAKHVTACAFGGQDGRSLFITSAAPDGRVFVADVGVAGPPAHVFQGLSTAPSDAEPTSAR